MDTVKDRVKQLCYANHTNIKQLEKALGFANGTIQKWDKYNPRMDKLSAVATYFGVPIEALTGAEVPEQKENPAAVIGNEVDDAVHALVINLFDRLSPEDQKDLIADLIEKARNQ